jgi:AraC-like DNA-binding protein
LSVVFWAALPHRVAAAADGAAVRWLTVPLVDALGWDVEGAHTARLLGGELAVHPGRDGDAAALERWEADLADRAPVRRRAAELEIRAHLDRLALLRPADPPADDPGRHVPRVAAMAAFLAARFRDPITVADVAAHVHLHAATASAAFRAATGVPPGAFLLQCRLAEAQRLLLVTDAGVDEVAARSGFGSTSQFYARFTRDRGRPPAAYRRWVRAGRPGA